LEGEVNFRSVGIEGDSKSWVHWSDLEQGLALISIFLAGFFDTLHVGALPDLAVQPRILREEDANPEVVNFAVLAGP